MYLKLGRGEAPKFHIRPYLLLLRNLFFGCGFDLTRICCLYVTLVSRIRSAANKFTVLGSLELASKNILTGAAKIVYAIVYSLSLVSTQSSPYGIQSEAFVTGILPNSGI